uniref:Putative secreted protein n=1 Tax=Corethrella appendiculata TaxID=1370023 RepID=U5ERZ4_9DIPT
MNLPKLIYFTLVFGNVFGAIPFIALGVGLLQYVFSYVQNRALGELFQVILGQIFPGPEHSEIELLQIDLIRKFDEVSNKLLSTEKIVINHLANEVEINSNLMPIFKRIESFVHRLNDLLEQLHYYSKHNKTNKLTMLNFAKSIINFETTSIASEMKIISNMITSRAAISGKSFMGWYIASLTTSRHHKVCNLTTSAQQTLFDFVLEIIRAEFITMHLSQFSIRMLAHYEIGKFQMEANLTRQHFLDRIQSYAQMLQENIGKLDRIYWKCDPKKHLQGETFLEMNRLIVATIVNEGYLAGYCESVKCEQYTAISTRTPRNRLDCIGGFYDCKKLSNYYQYCESDYHSATQFAYMSSNGLSYGSKSSCKSNIVNIAPPKEPDQIHCEYCVCDCSLFGDDIDNHHYLSLLPQVSDIGENKVIAGLRFRKISRNILSLQILQGNLLPHGKVNESTIEWKTIVAVNRKLTNEIYTFIWWKRDIVMRVLDVPVYDSVVTGVRFFRNRNDQPEFALRFTLADLQTGLLDQSVNATGWISTENIKTGKIISKMDTMRSTMCPETSTIDSVNGDVVRFGRTRLSDDGGQATVPFFDAQNIITTTMSALHGAGILYKGTPQCGGFITPIVKTLHESFLDSFNNSTDEININWQRKY